MRRASPLARQEATTPIPLGTLNLPTTPRAMRSRTPGGKPVPPGREFSASIHLSGWCRLALFDSQKLFIIYF